MDTATGILFMMETSVPLLALVVLIGLVIDATAPRIARRAALASVGLKLFVVVLAVLVLDPLGDRLGYLAPLIVFSGLAIPAGVVVVILDVRVVVSSVAGRSALPWLALANLLVGLALSVHLAADHTVVEVVVGWAPYVALSLGLALVAWLVRDRGRRDALKASPSA